MRLYEVFGNNNITLLQEGGNLSLPTGETADTINLKIHNRTEIVKILYDLLQQINRAYHSKFQEPLWDSHLLKNLSFLSGSSLHLFNPQISDDEFTRVKPKVGDIDTQVDKHKEQKLEELLTSIQQTAVGPAKFLGFKRGNEQFSTLWLLSQLPIKIQIDMEFVGYEDGKPTPWAQFSHSSDWQDLQAGVKGVFHKYLIQSFSTLTTQQFLLRKSKGRGKNKTLHDVLVKDTMISFAVSSKEGGGLRQKYEPVIDPATGKQERIKGRLVYTARPTKGYDQSLASIFTKLFGKRLGKNVWKHMSHKFWSFTGLLTVMNTLLKDSEKQQVLDTFIEKLFAKTAQGLYKEDPDRDIEEKMTALKLMLETLDMSVPIGLEDKVKEYKENYSIDNDLTESGPNYRRISIKHISKPGSSAELKDTEFLDLVTEIHNNGGTLANSSVSLKVDGAGCRFGRDDQGRPFF